MIERANGGLINNFYFLTEIKFKINLKILFVLFKIKNKIKKNYFKIIFIIKNFLLKIQNYCFYYYYSSFDNYFLNKIRILVSLLCNVNTVKQVAVLEGASPYFSVLLLTAFVSITSDQQICTDDMLKNLTGEELDEKFNKFRSAFCPTKDYPAGSPDFEFKFYKKYTSSGTRFD